MSSNESDDAVDQMQNQSQRYLCEPILDESLPTLNASKKRGPVNRGTSTLFCACQTRNDILVVDDNVFNIMTLQTILESSLKIKSDKALNGKIAVDMVAKRILENENEPCRCSRKRVNYKLIFMDCNMPVMDGFQAT